MKWPRVNCQRAGAWLLAVIVVGAVLWLIAISFIRQAQVDALSASNDALRRQVSSLGATPVAPPAQTTRRDPAKTEERVDPSPPPAPSVVPQPGPTGPSGSPGRPGANSTVPGPSGAPGEPGATGAPGKDGRDGTDGKDGADSTVPGPKGDQGPPGPACPDGYTLAPLPPPYEAYSACKTAAGTEPAGDPTPSPSTDPSVAVLAALGLLGLYPPSHLRGQP